MELFESGEWFEIFFQFSLKLIQIRRLDWEELKVFQLGFGSSPIECSGGKELKVCLELGLY